MLTTLQNKKIVIDIIVIMVRNVIGEEGRRKESFFEHVRLLINLLWIFSYGI